MPEPPIDDPGFGNDEIDEVAIPKSIAGKALLDKLRSELDGVDFGMLKTVASSSGTATFQYCWCEPMKSFLAFLSRYLKLSAATSYHDAVKYLIFRMVLGGEGRLEVSRGKHRIDLVDVDGLWHEVKTRELKGHDALALVIRNFVRKVQRDVAGRDAWWLAFLRASKGIKTRACSKYLGLLRLPAAVARTTTRKADFSALIQELVDMADHAESELVDEENIDEDELEEGFLFGVENQVTQSLRKEVIAKTKALKQSNAEIQQKDAEIQQDKAEIQQKDAEIQRLREENRRLKSVHREPIQ
ncbi:MAG TPA: hypothetical protein VKM55_25160 [Candidatus Lokiarchaeia archaeon]|nr:hypothetical protein [Candidatus Lokiarchaeia archaeon]